MNLSNKVDLNKEDLIIYNKNKLVVIYNKKLSKHIILSEEVYNFFEVASIDKITIKEFIACFEDVDDRHYMEQVIINMIKVGAINHENYKQNIEQSNCISECIYVCLTNRCNLKCKHCCSGCSSDKNDFFNTQEIKDMVDIIKKLNPKFIIITGGEPLIRSDFEEIITYIRKSIPEVYLILSTNGILINNKNIDFIIKNFNKIDISIDGVDEKTCSETRGKGVFKKILVVIEQLQAKGFENINLSMVFGDKNENLRNQFSKLNESLKTTSVERYFVPQGRGIENVAQYLSDDTLLPISIPNMLNDKTKKSKKISSCACNALKSQIFINDDGKIYPCPSLIKDEYMIGSIFDKKTVSNIINRDFKKIHIFSNIKNIYPYNFKKCKDCDVNVFCWHCPALLDSVKDNDKELNKWCDLMKNNLNRIIWDEEVM